MKNPLSLICGTCLLLNLTGCQSAPQRMPEIITKPMATEQSQEQNQTIHEASSPDESLPKNFNIARALSRAIKHLSNGRIEKAKTLLHQVLLADPDNANAHDFLRQINADPTDYLGDQYILYTAKPGDTMTKLADRVLKDHLKFFILTRYSGFNDPSSLVVGQQLKLPISTAAVDGDWSTQQSLTLEALALMDKRKYLAAIGILEPYHQQNDSAMKELSDTLVRAYLAESRRREHQEDYQSALYYLEKAEAIAQGRPGLRNKISELERKAKAQQLYEMARSRLKEGEFEAALMAINESRTLDPDLEEAILIKERITRKLINAYHKQALKHFGKRELTEAIRYWNKVLRVDPTSQAAIAYKTRSLQMIGAKIGNDTNKGS